MIVLVPKYVMPRGYSGLTIFPFVFVIDKQLKNNETFLNHEKIHLRQQLELLILPFFIWYFLEFLFRYSQLFNWKKAYRAISFEKEAYLNESDFKYLKKRRLFSFLKHM